MAIITISRGTFSGGKGLAECVAQQLDYRCVSREVLAEGAKQYDVPEDKLYDALTKKPGILERLTQERAHYLAFVRAALIKEAKDEKLVYHGHAGHLLLSGVPHLLKVRVIADMEFRIKAAMERNHMMSRGEAIDFIKKVDEERIRWTKFLYQVDWQNPVLYDLIINLDKLSLEDACSIVCHMADQERYKATLESQKILDDLTLSSHVKAMIANMNIGDNEIEVEADGGVVTLGGTVGLIENIDKIENVVRMIPGVWRVITQMGVRHSWGDAEGLRIR